MQDFRSFFFFIHLIRFTFTCLESAYSFCQKLLNIFPLWCSESVDAIEFNESH